MAKSKPMPKKPTADKSGKKDMKNDKMGKKHGK